MMFIANEKHLVRSPYTYGHQQRRDEWFQEVVFNPQYSLLAEMYLADDN